jgi:hypothetical protein
VLPETFPHPKLLPGPSHTQIDSLSPIAQAGSPSLRHLSVVQLFILLFNDAILGYYCFDLSCPITKG